MPLDIKLDFNNHTIINELVSGKDRILQQIKIAVRIWYYQWQWDSEYGINCPEDLRNKNLLLSQVSNMISQVDGVQKIINITIDDVFDSHGKGELILNAIIYLDGELIKIENEALASL